MDEVLTILMCDVSGHNIGSALMANRIYSETLHHARCGRTHHNRFREGLL
jgi:hypothetical protein